jgi:hypothetical protein
MNVNDKVWIVEDAWRPVEAIFMGYGKVRSLRSKAAIKFPSNMIFKTHQECIDYLVSELEKERYS